MLRRASPPSGVQALDAVEVLDGFGSLRSVSSYLSIEVLSRAIPPPIIFDGLGIMKLCISEKSWPAEHLWL